MKTIFKRKNEANNKYFILNEGGLSYYTDDDNKPLFTCSYRIIFKVLDGFLGLIDHFQKISEEDITGIWDDDEAISGDDPGEHTEQTDYSEEEKSFLKLCKKEFGEEEDDEKVLKRFLKS